MPETQRDLICSALSKLSGEQVERMERAFDLHRVSRGGWFDCPLAYAYGEPGTLIQDYGSDHNVSMEDEVVRIFGVTTTDVANVLGLSVPEVNAVTRAFDNWHETEVGRDELLSLITERIAHAEVAHV